MRKYIYGSALLLFLSLLLLQSTSFSNTELLNKATVSSVSESQALLSVHYGEGRLFWITNNMENTVHVRDSGYFAPNESFHIGPGRSNSFTILGHPEEIVGSILVDVEWDGGHAMVESEIPQANIEQILLELLVEEEIVEEEIDIEEDAITDEEDAVTEQDDEEQEEITTVQEEQQDKEVSEENEEDTPNLEEIVEESAETTDDSEE